MIPKIRNSYVTSVVAGGLVVTYAVSRLIGLTTLPIFCDEAIHIQWAVQILRGHLLAPLDDENCYMSGLLPLAFRGSPIRYGSPASLPCSKERLLYMHVFASAHVFTTG